MIEMTSQAMQSKTLIKEALNSRDRCKRLQYKIRLKNIYYLADKLFR